MSKRRDFSRKQRAQIICRATDPRTGQIRCEGCGLILGRKPYQIDHTIAEELIIDKTRELTIDDGKLLGQACCHKPKTADDIRVIRKSDRIRDKNSGAMKRPSSFQTSRDGPYRQKISGGLVWRDTGKPVGSPR